VTTDYLLLSDTHHDERTACQVKSILLHFMRGVTLDFSRPGKPTDNAFIESLNGKFRAECLNANPFLSFDEARRKCETWRRDYNEVRPHSAIGNQVHAMLHRSAGNPGQTATR
jgi:putative transposase